MPGQVYTGTVSDMPREARFHDKYERTGFVMDSANLNFVWLHPDAFSEALDDRGRALGHQHPFDMYIYVIHGDLRFHADDVEYFLKAGDFIYVPRDVFHGGRPSGNQPVHVLEIFAPIRTDYLYTAEHQLAYKQAPRKPDGSRRDLRTLMEAAADMRDSHLAQPGKSK